MKKHDICSLIISLEDELQTLKQNVLNISAKLRLSAIKENKTELRKLYDKLSKISKLEKQQVL